MARVLLLDNYDSFTFNLAQSLRVLGAEVLVHRNDQITVEEALALQPTHVVVSPGPGRPEDAGISIDLLRAAMERGIPALGVCLGHQSIGALLGGQVVRAERLMHGKASAVRHDGSALYSGVSSPFTAARYHSLVVAREGLPDSLVITCETDDGEIMGFRHRDLPLEGVQFHPESILTPEGDQMLANFLGVPRDA